MTEIARNRVPWRIIGWGGAVLLLATPFVAMRFTSEVNWTASDFIVAGVLFAGIGGMFELAVRTSGNVAYRTACALALLGTLLVVWANLAVGIVGSEGNPANLLFFVALLLGAIGAALVRFDARGMVRAMAGTAAALEIAFVIVLTRGTDEPFVSHWVELAGVSAFATLFLGSAVLFRKAAQSSF